MEDYGIKNNQEDYSFSQIQRSNKSDIYSGEEQIEFIKRNPIYRTLMKLEFENVLRSYKK